MPSSPFRKSTPYLDSWEKEREVNRSRSRRTATPLDGSSGKTGSGTSDRLLQRNLLQAIQQHPASTHQALRGKVWGPRENASRWTARGGSKQRGKHFFVFVYLSACLSMCFMYPTWLLGLLVCVFVFACVPTWRLWQHNFCVCLTVCFLDWLFDQLAT